MCTLCLKGLKGHSGGTIKALIDYIMHQQSQCIHVILTYIIACPSEILKHLTHGKKGAITINFQNYSKIILIIISIPHPYKFPRNNDLDYWLNKHSFMLNRSLLSITQDNNVKDVSAASFLELIQDPEYTSWLSGNIVRSLGSQK